MPICKKIHASVFCCLLTTFVFLEGQAFPLGELGVDSGTIISDSRVTVISYLQPTNQRGQTFSIKPGN
jgi:hypothetical protein